MCVDNVSFLCVGTELLGVGKTRSFLDFGISDSTADLIVEDLPDKYLSTKDYDLLILPVDFLGVHVSSAG